MRELELSDYFDIRQNEIRSSRGNGLILFQGMADHTAESIKSLEGFDCAWVEEAQSISQRSLDLLRPTIRKPGSELQFTWNPQNETDPVDVLLRGKHPPADAVVQRVNYQNNPWFPPALHQEIAHDKKYNYDKYLHVWEGEYLQCAETRVFKNWRVEDFETPKDVVFRLGADFGDGGPSPTTLVRMFLVGRKMYVDYEAYKIGCEIDHIPNLFLTVPESEKWPIVGDSARQDLILFLQKRGFHITGAVKGHHSVDAGVNWLLNYEIIVHPRCIHTADELKTYSHPVDKLTGKVLPGFVDARNHIIDPMRYAIEDVRRLDEGRPVNVIPIPIYSRWNRAA